VTERNLNIEMLTPERVDELWTWLEPLLTASCQSNEIGADDITSGDIYCLAQTDQCVLFIFTDNGKPQCVIGIQFHMANGKKGADLIAMAGKNLSRFRDAFWESILNWLRVNDCVFLDAYGNERLAKHYIKRFGFSKSCTYVRMIL